MSQYLLLNQTSSNYECRIYNNRITDEEILSAFGESIRFDEGKFKIDSFIDCLEDRADVMGLCITEKSKKELLQHLKELVIKLVSEL